MERPAWWDALLYTRKINADWNKLASDAENTRKLRCDIVLANGVFDILHPGHLLKLAAVRRSPFDFVIVSLDTDLQVRADKGRYPALSWRERAAVLASVQGVDAVTAHGQGVGALGELMRLLAGTSGRLRWHRREDAPATEDAAALEAGVEIVRSPRNGPWASSALRGGT